MKRAYRALYAFIVILMSLCCGCRFFGPQQYICVAENVKSIQILRLVANRPEASDYDYTVLCEITDTVTFVKQLNNLQHETYIGAPKIPNVGDIVIQIEYLNGDYDFINHRAQWFRREDKTNSGHFLFDQAEFDALISTYLTQ